ncbi:hypothetical protein FHW36_101253 [Chitinophaga polysaccharea]|uniref:O-antigen ligase-like membrane protein n=1 Tax=Chitinophaga polysaccharea TaxID=1293035 RepID=A0A561Q1V3_9BACT|nr:hypothetical protein [Chitinophaga polysaccharea]TWF44333.1 hypothetical protein FHW36_101253 [Chitinophaga polysaccharea]
MKHSYNVLLVFLVIFNFKIPVIQYSAVFACMLSTVTYARHPKYIAVLKKTASKKYIAAVPLTLLGLILLLPLSPILHQTYDFAILKPYFLQLILICITIYILPILIINAEENIFLYFLKIIVTVFFIQSLIEIFAFMLPPFANLVHFFQKSEIAEMNMGGLRALALTGNPFFSLSASFGLLYIILFKYFQEQGHRIFSLSNVGVFAVCVIGTFFAGRTGFIGILFGLALLIFSARSIYFKLGSIVKIFSILTIAIGIIILLLPAEIYDLVVDKLLPFAFEFVYSYIEGGTVTTTSTDALSNMYFPISIQTFILGDGRYMDFNGSGYYMSTDAGYMRQILFFGVFGILAMFIYQMVYFVKPVLVALNRRLLSQRYNDLLFFLIVFAYMLLVHYKGEVIGFLPEIQIMLLIMFTGYLSQYYFSPIAKYPANEE